MSSYHLHVIHTQEGTQDRALAFIGRTHNAHTQHAPYNRMRGPHTAHLCMKHSQSLLTLMCALQVTCATEKDEAFWVAGRCEGLHRSMGQEFKTMAVLYRTNMQARVGKVHTCTSATTACAVHFCSLASLLWGKCVSACASNVCIAAMCAAVPWRHFSSLMHTA